jgi:threonine/homoserine efflux transporter RhtA
MPLTFKLSVIVYVYVLGLCIVPFITAVYTLVCTNPEEVPQLKVCVAVVSVIIASVGVILVTTEVYVP